jgi:hypothetical protein
MKKLSIFLIAVALIAGIVGCVGGNGDNRGGSYTLIIDITAGGTVTVDNIPLPAKAILTYDAGTVVSLNASPSADYYFVNWTGDVDTIDDANAAATSITMNDDYSITANFEEEVVDTGVILQEGNDLPQTKLQSLESKELEDNRIGDMWSLEPIHEWSLDTVVDVGLKWTRLSIDWNDYNQVESTGAYSEYYIDPEQDKAITDLANNGVKITYILVFWDEAIQVEEDDYSRFRIEEEIQRYLDYVKFVVHHFKDRIEYYEILNEPNVGHGTQQSVEVADYINLVKRTIPVIRQEYLEAKIVVGAVTPLSEPGALDYFFTILGSDVMPLVDAVSWHCHNRESPENVPEYYYNYPTLVQEIKDTASVHGFEGEYVAEELHWRTPTNPHPHEPSIYSETTSAKYYARGIVMHLGMDVTVGLAETSHELDLPKMTVIRNLCTVMAGAEPISLSTQIESDAENIKSYAFSLSNGEKLLTLWTDGVAVDDDPGIEATVTLTWFSAEKVVGIDVLNGFEQDLMTCTEDGDLVIEKLLVKDYPIILQLSP